MDRISMPTCRRRFSALLKMLRAALARIRKSDPPGRARLATKPKPGWGSPCDDDVDFEPGKLGRDLGQALAAPVCPAIFDRDRAALDPTEVVEPPRECGRPLTFRQRCAVAQESDNWSLRRLLRARRQRPCNRTAAEQRYELAASHGVSSQAQDHTLKSNRVGRSATSIHVRNPQYRRSMQWICSCGVMPGSEPPEAIGSARNKQGARLSTTARHRSASPPAATTLAPCE